MQVLCHFQETPHPNPAPSPFQGRPSRGEGLRQILSYFPSPLEGEGLGVRGLFAITKTVLNAQSMHYFGEKADVLN